MSPKPRPPVPTHFLCIPLASALSRPQLSASLAAFRADACSPSPANGFGAGGVGSLPLIPEDAVRPVGTLHLTLGVFSFTPVGKGGLGDGGFRSAGEAGEVGMGDAGGKEVEPKPRPTLDRAKEVLAGLKLKEIWQAVTANAPVMPGAEKPAVAKQQQEGHQPPRITLRGLASMQAPTKAAVLYAPPVDQLGLLQAFCERVRDVFREAELMVDEGRPLLLHATVVNTVYSKQKQDEGGGGKRRGGRGGRGGGGWGRNRERLVFDATGFIERYEDQIWMEEVPIEKVALCKMGAKKVVVNGVEDAAYEVEAEVVF